MTTVSKKPKNYHTIVLDKKCKQKNFFICYETEVLEYLLKTDVHIQSIAKSEKLIAQTFSELQIPPQYVQVEFNDTFVKIALLK